MKEKNITVTPRAINSVSFECYNFKYISHLEVVFLSYLLVQADRFKCNDIFILNDKIEFQRRTLDTLKRKLSEKGFISFENKGYNNRTHYAIQYKNLYESADKLFKDQAEVMKTYFKEKVDMQLKNNTEETKQINSSIEEENQQLGSRAEERIIPIQVQVQHEEQIPVVREPEISSIKAEQAKEEIMNISIEEIMETELNLFSEESEKKFIKNLFDEIPELTIKNTYYQAGDDRVSNTQVKANMKRLEFNEQQAEQFLQYLKNRMIGAEVELQFLKYTRTMAVELEKAQAV